MRLQISPAELWGCNLAAHSLSLCISLSLAHYRLFRLLCQLSTVMRCVYCHAASLSLSLSLPFAILHYAAILLAIFHMRLSCSSVSFCFSSCCWHCRLFIYCSPLRSLSPSLSIHISRSLSISLFLFGFLLRLCACAIECNKWHTRRQNSDTHTQTHTHMQAGRQAAIETAEIPCKLEK